MALNVISNFAANTARRNLELTDAALTSSLNKLSSGSRVVSAKDDAASLAIGSGLRAHERALQTATVNASQAGSLLQIAEVFKQLLRLQSEKPLSFREKKMLDRARHMLITEMCTSRSVGEAEAIRVFETALQKAKLHFPEPM